MTPVSKHHPPCLISALIITAALVGLACGGPSARREVKVELREWSIALDAESVKGGQVRFAVRNTGERAHELVLVKSDLPPDQLPTVDGRLDQSKVNVEKASPRLQVDADATGSIDAALSPGKYVLICNLVDSGGSGSRPQSHYQNGMYASFFVEL
jgi:hypothetical protein